jgi:hypothetical protein
VTDDICERRISIDIVDKTKKKYAYVATKKSVCLVVYCNNTIDCIVAKDYLKKKRTSIIA